MARKVNFMGFTLIELIIVITVLGLLAVTVAPRFIDISSEAKTATIKGLSSAIRSATKIQHSVAQINANKGGLINGFVSDDNILFDQGYPVALDFDSPGGGFNNGDGVPEILEAVEINLADWTFAEVISGSEAGLTTRELYLTLRTVIADNASAAEIIATNCYLSYDSFLTVSRPPVVKTVSSGC